MMLSCIQLLQNNAYLLPWSKSVRKQPKKLQVARLAFQIEKETVKIVQNHCFLMLL